MRYAETDQMGIVHHSNYYVWFELGRSEYCRAKGFSYGEMEEKEDAMLVVAESSCRYKNPSRYDDLLTIRTAVEKIRSRSIVFVYEVIRESDETIVAEGRTLHIVVDRQSRIRSFPEKYRALLIEGA